MARHAPKRLKAITKPSVMIAVTRNANGGGVRSDSRKIPDAATRHVIAIQTHAATLLSAAARRMASIGASDRRHAAAVPHTRRHARNTGRTMKVSGAGSKML